MAETNTDNIGQHGTQVVINKDTTVCMSLAARPSNFGTRFHNHLYQALGLNYVYKAFQCEDLAGAISGVRALGVRGCAISMPFKEAVIDLVDELAASAKAIDSVNTVVNSNGYLTAYNTDYSAIAALIKQYQVSPELSFALKGAGGMAKAVACALRDAGFRRGVIVARNEQKGRALAKLCGFDWVATLQSEDSELLINATPIGMQGDKLEYELAFSHAQIAAANVVFDVVALPEHTPLVKCAQQLEKRVIKGSEVFALQALEQFELYTGIRPTKTQFEQAAAYSRQQ